MIGATLTGASALLPLADDGGQLEVRQRARRRTARRAAALGGVLINNIRRGPPPLQPPPRPAQPSQPPPPYAGSCPAAARPLLEATAARLERGGGAAVAAAGSGSKSSSASSSGGDGSAGGGGSYFTAQRGAVTWGLTDAGDDGACNDAVSGCAANNPSAPYGLVVLPLAPEESLAAKLRGNSTPQYVRDNLQDSRLYGGGRSPVWQLRRDEVVLVAGCAPAEAASRYFSATGYLYSEWQQEEASWLTAFASLGDSLSLVRTPGALRPRAGPRAPAPRDAALRNRLNTSAVRPAGAGGAPTGTGGSSGSGGASGGSASNTSSSASGSGSASGSPFDEFFVVVMGSDPRTVAAAKAEVAAAVAAAAAGAAASGAAAPAAAAGQQQSRPPAGQEAGPAAAKPSQQAAPAVLALPFLNEIPIPGPAFGERLGLAPTAPYMMLLLRDIVGGAGPGARGQFKAYSAAGALRAWRLTPRAAPGAGGGEAGNGGPPTYPLPAVISRFPRGFPRVAAAGGTPGALCDALLARNASEAAGAAAGGLPPRVGAVVGCLISRAAAAADATAIAQLDGASLTSPAPAGAGASSAVGKESGPVPLLQTAAGASAGTVTGVAAPAGGPLPPLLGNLPSPLNQIGGGDQAQPQDVAKAAAAAAAAAAVAAAAAANVSDADASALRARVWEQLARGGLESEALLQPACDYLIGRVELAAARGGMRVAHSLGSAPPFELLGIDWGLDCVRRGLDFCNGDNRDASYITSWPLVSVDRPGQRLSLVGVNHAAAGTASFCNIALTDPLRRKGLTAFEDTGLAGSAQRYLAGTPYEWAAPLLYAVEFAHDCAGAPYCLGLDPAAPGANEPLVVDLVHAPTPAGAAGGQSHAAAHGGGAKNASSIAAAAPAPPQAAPGPLRRPPAHAAARARQAPGAPAAPSTVLAAPLLVISRAYVNPATGVGPDGRTILGFHAMVLTPNAIALPSDVRPRYDTRIFASAPGAIGTLGSTQQEQGAADGGGGNSTVGGGAQGERRRRGAAPPGACVQSVVGFAQCASGSWDACCQAMGGWGANGCWCSQEGEVLLGSMPTVLAKAALTGVSLSCGLPAGPRTCPAHNAAG